MKKLAIIYHSGFGHTAKTAESVAAGARGVNGVEVDLIAIKPEKIEGGRWKDDEVMASLSASDAIVFGAPTYMGTVSGPFKCFADATAPYWLDQSWKDKLAGGFTSSGYASGDKLMTLHYLVTLAMQLRMVWIGPVAPASNITQDGRDIDRWGYYLGVGVVGNMQQENQPSEGDLRTAELYGKRLARTTLHWERG